MPPDPPTINTHKHTSKKQPEGKIPISNQKEEENDNRKEKKKKICRVRVDYGECEMLIRCVTIQFVRIYLFAFGLGDSCTILQFDIAAIASYGGMHLWTETARLGQTPFTA